MRTEEIAEVLGAEPESVEASRDEALQRIAGDVGIDELDEVRARLAELPADEWLGRRNGTAVAEVEPEDADAEAEAKGPASVDEPKKRRSLWPMLLGLLLIAGVIVAIALGTSGSDNKTASPTSASASTPKPAPASNSAPGPAKLAPIGAAKASGTATLSGKTLTLKASGLPNGHYEVWVYNSILDATSIAKANGGSFTVSAGLPGNWKRYRYVDVSREQADGNVSHSGVSVLRVPTSSLR